MEYHDHDPVQMEEEISSRGFLFCFQVSPDDTSSRTLVEEEKKKKEKKTGHTPNHARKDAGGHPVWRCPADQPININVPMRSIVFAWGKPGRGAIVT